jgi:acetyl-CoA C-acetyltransferase
MLGVQAISQGDAEVVVAGGMESMSNVPYYLPTARAGMRLGNATAIDGLIHDGLWDAP